MEKLARPVIAGNWKMHKTISEARHLAADIVSQAASLSQASLILIPPFTAIQEVKKTVSGSHLLVGG
ncbi:MAG TPA: triose-phosphate isomerase, partial [Candidatus Saccharicenans sp.]|nr:triose-phosphate isomerase [Candidatus Saccharicenans sp.]